MIEKQIAGEKATELIQDGMTVGLGTGSTAYYFLKKLSELVKKGLKITGVSTSNSTTGLALSYNIPLISIDEIEKIDVTIDGADEVDEQFNGIKGGGGALLYEKIIASMSDKNIWILDSSKLVKKLGKFPLPVEVVPYGYKNTINKLRDAGFNPSIRKKNGAAFLSDASNYIVDLNLGSIENMPELENKLKLIPGVIESGLFINCPDKVVVGFNNEVKILDNNLKS